MERRQSGKRYWSPFERKLKLKKRTAICGEDPRFVSDVKTRFINGRGFCCGFIEMTFAYPSGWFSVNQFFVCYIKNFAQGFQLNIRYIAFICFNSRDNIFVHIISGKLEFIGQQSL